MRVLLVLLLLLASAAVAADPLLRLGVAPPDPVKLGEPIRLVFTVRNVSQAPVLVADPTVTPRPTVAPEDWGVVLEVTGPDGRVTRLERFDEYAAYVRVRPESFRTLGGGAALQGHALLGAMEGLTRWVVRHPGRTSLGEEEMDVLGNVFGRPGLYSVRAVYTNRVHTAWTDAGVQEVKAWQGRLTSKAVRLRILP